MIDGSALVDGPVPVQGLLPVSVQVGDREYLVRPPTLAEALVLMAATPSGIGGDEDDLALVLDTARNWLPRRLYRTLFGGRLFGGRLFGRMDPRPGIAALAELVSAMANGAEERQPTGRESTDREPTDPAPTDPAPIDWPTLLAEYCHAYHVRPEDALNAPFPRFLQLAGRVRTLEARADLRLLTVRAVPYVSDASERERLLDDLRRTARLAPAHVPEQGLSNLQGLRETLFAGGGLNPALA